MTAVVILVVATKASAQVSTDVIRGRVTDPDAHPVQGVEVRATSYQGQVTKTATTDKSGRFTIIFINGEGDYWLAFRKLGFAPKRFEIRKVGDEEVMLADARLSSTIAALDAVTTVGERNRALPNRNGAAADVGGGDRPLGNNGLPTDQAGNLAAMAAAVAGFQLIPGLGGAPDMYSVLGLSGDQNNVTFNGLGSGISALPPDVLATTSINPYPFDVSKGGFSGAQISIQTIPGSNFSRRSVTNADITPPLEWADATAAAQGQKYTNARIGGNAAGPITMDEIFYNAAYNVGRRFNDTQSLLNANALGLTAAGVSADSVARLVNILGQQRIPLSVGGTPGVQSQDIVQGLINFDVMPSASGTGHSFTFGIAGNYQRSQPVDRSGLLFSTPSHSDATSFWGANASLVHMNYFWFGVLSKTTVGLAAQAIATDPFEQIPEGIVRVTSLLPGGGSSVKSLSFGGNALRSSSANQTVQINNQLSWYSLDNAHTIRLTSSLAHDAFTSDVGQRLFGSYTFNSLTDLAAGTPASFARTLSSAAQSGHQLAGSMALGDYWRPSPSVQVQYGARVDANRFLTEPAFNPAVSATFGLRNDRLPDRAYVSPRLGVQWAYGQSSQIAYAPGSARPPQAVIHAGVGVFQNIAPALFVAPSMSATGLPASTQSIACVGAAVPFPRWDSFLTDPGSIPAECAGGAASTALGTGAPSVSLFDSRFRQPRSVRAAGDWSGPVLDNRFVLGVQGIVSSGLDQQGAVDVNVQRTPRFTLPKEAGRPVFADPGSIVVGTGSIGAGASRVSPDFQSVWVQRSDLATRSRQLTVNVKPVTANAKLRWDATYTLLDVREQYFGFTSTAGDPFDTQWGPHLQTSRHALSVRWSDFPIFDVVYVTAAVVLASGQKYTPMIATDVNGDGAANDRAFIPDPATTADAAAAAAMRSLLANGSSSARACLAGQFNHLADRGSCQAPWTANNVIAIKFNPRKIGLPKRATVSLQVLNPLGLADLALHGANGVRGWGQNIAPDQNLLFVRGFDAATREFKYEVNQRFGSTRPSESATHTLPYVSLSVSLDVGVPRERQLLTQRLDAGRGRAGDRANTETMKSLGTSAIPNPMAMLLSQEHELELNRVQADSLANLSHKFSVFADSVWTPVATYFAALPAGYNHGDAYGRYVSARERTVDYLLTLVPHANGLLTASQRRRLPLQISNFLDRRVLEFLRSSTMGDNGSVAGR
ncbi:MAG: hypothetical protein JWM41_4967 [Gemmatimonadetes bacterium]|nr:hypothetical protein [Gemmatimonadota bacterium]